ncbi:MAG TPA: bifunctional 4-hydroxy-3-methylbut-2-enyl diphosphate reductase/30S ribosomal protein S1 [Anaerovoracaceae bacterium]|nr:bifunctional 4-hydroxy-3-methylbut-2-enyl diphosphate reductase/30S ribosomal protein S1 [Anaerovoracaceae bacterium]
MREIIRADHSGFCFGVKKAIETTENQIKTRGDRKIYTYGQLIHNRIVTDDLEKRGVGVINDIDEAEAGCVIIIRSHGAEKRFYDAAREQNLEIVDATCPFVAKIHDLAHEAHMQGKKVVIIGDAKHPEVMGTNGWCDDSAIIINSPQEAAKIQGENILVVCQTTIEKELLDSIKKVFEENKLDCEIKNTICNATTERQNSCGELAKKVDMMVIIGSKESSNSQKLFKISKKSCNNSYFTENKTDLPLKQIQKCNKIGVAAGASTPERVIKEVIATMSEITLENNEKNLMEDFMDEIDASLRLPRTGEIVNGKVHQVTEKEVIVNMGCKKDGIIPKDEVTLEGDQKLTDLFKEGDEIQAKVIKTDDGDGGILLSKKKLEVNEHWSEINDALENKTIINVKVVRQVNGGVIAAYKEVSGFIPLSQLSERFVENADEFMGQTMDVRVTRVDMKRGRAVFSHKSVLMEERQKIVEAVWSNLHVDDIVEGTVMRFTDYGAFIDLGGIDGLLHISEISWGKLKHPKEVLEIGEKVSVKILSMNAEKGKISLGLKQTVPEPWSVIDDKYQVGQVVSGKVVQIKEYGAFVELEPGLDGLVHISEVAHKRVTNIADELTLGQDVDAKILEIDRERKRISLSIKETTDADEEAVEAPAEEAAPVEEAPVAEAVEEAHAEEVAPETEA